MVDSRVWRFTIGTFEFCDVIAIFRLFISMIVCHRNVQTMAFRCGCSLCGFYSLRSFLLHFSFASVVDGLPPGMHGVLPLTMWSSFLAPIRSDPSFSTFFLADACDDGPPTSGDTAKRMLLADSACQICISTTWNEGLTVV